jgi:hypothetical protein
MLLMDGYDLCRGIEYGNVPLQAVIDHPIVKGCPAHGKGRHLLEHPLAEDKVVCPTWGEKGSSYGLLSQSQLPHIIEAKTVVDLHILPLTDDEKVCVVGSYLCGYLLQAVEENDIPIYVGKDLLGIVSVLGYVE